MVFWIWSQKVPNHSPEQKCRISCYCYGKEIQSFCSGEWFGTFFFGNGSKVKIPSEIKPSLVYLCLLWASPGLVRYMLWSRFSKDDFYGRSGFHTEMCLCGVTVNLNFCSMTLSFQTDKCISFSESKASKKQHLEMIFFSVFIDN